MLNLQVIGNLGADAERRENNGRPFVTFRVAHTERRLDGTESTIWISCVLNGDAGGLFELLKRGQKVFVQGRMRVRTFSSPKTHQIEAGVDLSVDRIELCGSQLSEERVKDWLNNNPDAAKRLANEQPF